MTSSTQAIWMCPSSWGEVCSGLESVLQNLDELILECRTRHESHRHLVEQIDRSCERLLLEGRTRVLPLLMFWLILPQGAYRVCPSEHLTYGSEMGSVRSECCVCCLAVEVVNPSTFGNNVVLLQSFIVGSIVGRKHKRNLESGTRKHCHQEYARLVAQAVHRMIDGAQECVELA